MLSSLRHVCPSSACLPEPRHKSHQERGSCLPGPLLPGRAPSPGGLASFPWTVTTGDLQGLLGAAGGVMVGPGNAPWCCGHSPGDSFLARPAASRRAAGSCRYSAPRKSAAAPGDRAQHSRLPLKFWGFGSVSQTQCPSPGQGQARERQLMQPGQATPLCMGQQARLPFSWGTASSLAHAFLLLVSRNAVCRVPLLGGCLQMPSNLPWPCPCWPLGAGPPFHPHDTLTHGPCVPLPVYPQPVPLFGNLPFSLLFCLI